MIYVSPKILLHWRNQLSATLTRHKWVVTSVFRESATHHSSGAGVDALPLSAVSVALKTGQLPSRKAVITEAKVIAKAIVGTSFVVEDHHVHFFFSGNEEAQFIAWGP